MSKRLPLLLALSLVSSPLCFGCATLAFDPVRTTDESALIVWNSKTHVEQFVRRATFESKAKDFGFLVPTPSRPTLSAADDAIFDSLERELEPKTVVKVQHGIDFAPLVPKLFVPRIKHTFRAAAENINVTTIDAKGVEVVEQKHVGAYNAVVLRASDSKTLSQWLKKHRYPVSSDTREWLAPYVRKGFYLSVFQIAANRENESAQAQAVRLSFKSDAPFFPYRESKRAQTQSGGRTLRVFFVGDERVEGSIQNENKSAKWPATTSYSAPLGAKTLASQKLDIPPGPLRLTAFEDFSSPRPGWGDLKFAASKPQRDIVPPPNIINKDARWWIPADALALGAVLLVWIGFASRGRKRHNQTVKVIYEE